MKSLIIVAIAIFVVPAIAGEIVIFDQISAAIDNINAILAR